MNLDFSFVTWTLVQDFILKGLGFSLLLTVVATLGGVFFGTLLALGDKPKAVFQLILAENALLGLFGAIAGVVLGCLVAMIVSAIGIPMPPPPNADIGYIAHIRLVPLDVLSAGGIGFVATCLAAVLPARRASRLKVVDALRQGV